MIAFLGMSPFMNGFGEELLKIASAGMSGKDVVMAEALGPIPSMVRGYQSGRSTGSRSALRGVGQAAKAGAGYVGGGALGALGGL